MINNYLLFFVVYNFERIIIKCLELRALYTISNENYRMAVKVQALSKSFYFSLLVFLYSFSTTAQDHQRFQGKSENLGSQVNSPFDELDPVFTPDGNTMYFTRSRHPENMGGRNDAGDIWMSTKDESGNWTAAINAGDRLNNVYYNAVAGFSPDGETIFLHHHYFKKGLRPSTQGLSVAKKTSDGWGTPTKLNIENFLNESQHQSGCLSADGKVMLLSLNSFGSYGYEDLYVSFLNANGTWTTPKNLGGTINTAHQEMTPYISDDNTTLYFASSGHNSKGSRDIFSARRLDNSWRLWSEPENVSEINSEGIELSFLVNTHDQYAYFISTQNSDGYGDINRIKVNPAFQPVDTTSLAGNDLIEPDTVIIISQNNPVVEEKPVVEDESVTGEAASESIQVSGVVYSGRDNQLLNARVNLIPVVEEEGYSPLSVKVENGKYNFELDRGIAYRLRASAEGYLTEEIKIDESSAAAGVINHDFVLAPLEKGATFQLNNVLFERGTSSLVDSSFQELDKVVEMMLENPALKIEIGGHTDNQGDARLNLKLSEQRVETVIDYLQEKGVEKRRMVGKGYGGSKPIASNRSEITRKLNRRVEFTVLEKN